MKSAQAMFEIHGGINDDMITRRNGKVKGKWYKADERKRKSSQQG